MWRVVLLAALSMTYAIPVSKYPVTDVRINFRMDEMRRDKLDMMKKCIQVSQEAANNYKRAYNYCLDVMERAKTNSTDFNSDFDCRSTPEADVCINDLAHAMEACDEPEEGDQRIHAGNVTRKLLHIIICQQKNDRALIRDKKINARIDEVRRDKVQTMKNCLKVSQEAADNYERAADFCLDMLERAKTNSTDENVDFDCRSTPDGSVCLDKLSDALFVCENPEGPFEKLLFNITMAWVDPMCQYKGERITIREKKINARMDDVRRNKEKMMKKCLQISQEAADNYERAVDYCLGLMEKAKTISTDENPDYDCRSTPEGSVCLDNLFDALVVCENPEGPVEKILFNITKALVHPMCQYKGERITIRDKKINARMDEARRSKLQTMKNCLKVSQEAADNYERAADFCLDMLERAKTNSTDENADFDCRSIPEGSVCLDKLSDALFVCENPEGHLVKLLFNITMAMVHPMCQYKGERITTREKKINARMDEVRRNKEKMMKKCLKVSQEAAGNYERAVDYCIGLMEKAKTTSINENADYDCRSTPEGSVCLDNLFDALVVCENPEGPVEKLLFIVTKALVHPMCQYKSERISIRDKKINAGMDEVRRNKEKMMKKCLKVSQEATDNYERAADFCLDMLERSKRDYTDENADFDCRSTPEGGVCMDNLYDASVVCEHPEGPVKILAVNFTKSVLHSMCQYKREGISVTDKKINLRIDGVRRNKEDMMKMCLQISQEAADNYERAADFCLDMLERAKANSTDENADFDCRTNLEANTCMDNLMDAVDECKKPDERIGFEKIAVNITKALVHSMCHYEERRKSRTEQKINLRIDWMRRVKEHMMKECTQISEEAADNYKRAVDYCIDMLERAKRNYTDENADFDCRTTPVANFCMDNLVDAFNECINPKKSEDSFGKLAVTFTKAFVNSLCQYKGGPMAIEERAMEYETQQQ